VFASDSENKLENNLRVQHVKVDGNTRNTKEGKSEKFIVTLFA
jgi:hypothetical protein